MINRQYSGDTKPLAEGESNENLLLRQLIDQHEENNPIDQDEERNQRERFNTPFQYMVSVLGISAGYGSIWRFPYLIYKNGGGPFLLPYFILTFTTAIPMFYLETALGQVSNSSGCSSPCDWPLRTRAHSRERESD